MNALRRLLFASLLAPVLWSVSGSFAEEPISAPGDDPQFQGEGPRADLLDRAETAPKNAPQDLGPVLTSVDGTWEPQGPGPISGGQVEGITNGHVCGAIHAVIAHPTNPDILYIGAVNGGVWKTTNATAATPVWTSTTGDLDSLSIGALAFDPNDATNNTVWAAIGRFSSYGRIGGTRSGLLRTTDGGATWTLVTGGGTLTGKNISGLVVRGNTILVSVNTADASGNANRGVWRSTNGGTSFTQMAVGNGTGSTGLPEGVSYDIVSSNSSPNTIYTNIALPTTTSARGIYKSTDLGATWTRVSTPTIDNFITSVTSNIEMSAGNADNLYVGILESGAPVAIFNTLNGGTTWSRMDLPTMPLTAATVHTVTSATNASPIVITTAAAHGYSNNNYVEISGVTGNTAANGLHQITVTSSTTFSLDFSTGNGTYLSGGSVRMVTSMNPRGSKGPEEGAPDDIAGGQGSIHFSILADPSNANLVYTGGDRQDLPFPNFIGAVNYSGNLWRGDASATPNGLSPSSQWRHLTHSNSVAGIPGGGTSNSSSPHADSRDMAMDASGRIIEVDDGGVFRRSSPQNNTGSWTSLAGNLQITEVHSVTYDTVSNIIITGNQDNGTSVQNTPGSLAYTAVSTGDGGDVAAARNPGNPAQSIRYSSFQNLGSFRRRVMSSSNTLVSQNFPALSPLNGDPAISGQFTTPVEINRIDANRLIIGASNGLYESLDQGATVSRVATQSPTDAINGSGRTMIYGGRKNSVDNADLVYFADLSTVYRRETSGTTPATVAGYTGGTVRSIITDPEDYDHLFAIDNNQVFRSTNGGATFTDITGDIPVAARDFRCLEFIRSGNDWAVVVGTLRGVYAARSDAVSDWGTVGTDLPNAYVWDMDYDPEDDLLVVGTLGRGVWRFPQASVIALIGPQPQTINFPPITDKLTTDSFTLSATGGGSGNPVTFAVTSGPATIGSGNVISFTGAGSVTITASQAGSPLYDPAPDVARTFNVTKATAGLTLTGLNQTYSGTPRVVVPVTTPPGLSVTLTYNGLVTAPTNVGSYAISAVINDAIYQGSASGTLVVSKATATVTLTNLSQVYNGGPRPVTVTTNPGGLSIILTYNGVASAPFDAGSYAVVATVNNPNYQGSASDTLIVGKAAQVISFPVAPATTLATETVTLAATGGGSVNPVTYSIVSGPGSVAGNVLTFTNSGVVRVAAMQPGDSNHFDATPVERDFNVIRDTANITLSQLTQVFDGNPKQPVATTTPSGLPVSFTYNGSATPPSAVGSYALAATVQDARYDGSAGGTFVIEKAPASVTLLNLGQIYDGSPRAVSVTTNPPGLNLVVTYNGLTGVPTGAGSYAVVATVDDPSYLGSDSGTLVVAKAAQSITFAPIPDQEATAMLALSAGGGGSGNPVTFTVTEGPASLNGNALTFSGTGDVSIRADQAGNANYEAAAPVFRTFAVTRERVDVFITGLAQPYDGTPRPVTVTTDPNGLPVSVTYAGSATPPTLPGTYFVLALVNEDFYEGDAGGFLEISKGVQTIDFPQPPDVLADATVTLAATGGPSGNPVTFELVSGPGSITGNQLSFTASGSVTVRALLAGNELYEDATPVERTLLVTKANAAVSLTDLQQTYDGSGKSPSASTIPAGLAVAFTFDGIPTPPVDAGSYDVVATVSDPRYQGSTSGELVIDKAGQTIDFPQPSDPIATDTVPLSATGGGSGEPVLFQVLSGPASISGGNQLSFSGAGSVLVEATQAGTANHLAALPVQRTLTVSKAPVGSLTLTNLHQVFDGNPRPVLPATQPPGLAVLLDYAGSVDAPTGTGSHAVTAVIDDPVYEGTVTGQLVVDDPFRIEVVAGGTLPPGSVLGAQTVADFEFSPHEVTGFVWNTVRTWANANGYDFGTLGDSCAADHPVQGINWFDAVKWCNARTEWENALRGRSVEPAYRLGGAVFRSGQPASADEVICDPGTSGYRLPSAIEREFAVRGGATPEGTIYPGSNDAAAVAWFAANAAGAPCDLLGGRGTRPAGLLAPNGSGFYDLSGNVAEWGNDPVGTLAGDRQVGGGSWDSAETGLRSDALVGGDPSTRDSRQGLRVTRSLSQSLAEGVDRTDLTWTSGGAEPWIAESGVNGAGTDAAGGEMPGVGEENWIETTAAGPGNLSFQWRIAAAGEAAELVVAVDGSDQAGITGDTGFVAGSVYLPTGSHTIRWTLSGLASVTPIPGRNAAWLDQVVVTPATLPVVEVTGVGELGESAATPAGSVPDDGGSPVTARGFRITPPGGSATDWPASDGGAGAFSVPVDSLLPGTTYRLVAYATNEVGTADSAEAIFTTDETVMLTDGLADRDRTIESGDGHGFLFSIEVPRRVLLASTGGAGLRAELYDGQGGLIASFEGAPDFLIDELLLAGDYELRVIRGGSGGAPADFSVQFDATELAESLPDVSVGPAPGIQIGKGVRNGGTGQVALLVSPKARAVVGFAEVTNAGILPDRMRVFAARGNSTFRVLYLGSGGNITAALNAGGFETSELAAGGEPERIRAFVTPNKRLIVKKVKRRTVTLKRTLFLPIRATSTFDPGETDSASIQVKTR